MKNKKILIVSECFYPEEFKINDIALSWQEKDYDVDVLTLNPTYPMGKVFEGYKNKAFYKETYNNINIYRIRAVTGYKDNLIKKILKYINFLIFGSIVAIFIGRKYDYVFGFNMSALTTMVPAILIRKLYKKPLMFWVQDLWPDSVYAYGFKQTKIMSYVLNSFVRYIYRSVTAIAIAGKGFESKLKPYAKAGLTFHYLPNWADDLNMDLEAVNFSGDSTTVNFTFAGNIGKIQNLENIIIAFSSLDSRYQTKSQLNIIGDGSNLSKLKELSLNKNIVFHGQKSRINIAKYYKASDFLIVSLIDKPIFSLIVPSKLQTYISVKKPILAIINGDTADIVNENNLGLCANPSSISDIADKFRKCIEMNQSERMNFVVENENLLSTVFNKTKIIDNLLNVLVGSDLSSNKADGSLITGVKK